VANVVSRRCKAHVVFGRNRFEGLDSQEVWQPRYTAIQCVTVNLPRAAYRARNEGDLLSELDRLAETAVAAHLEKRQFIEKLLSLKSVGPLALLAAEREGKPFLDLDYASCLVGVTGLNECVQALTGDELHGSGEALGLACRIAGHLSACFGEHSENEDINFVLGQARDTGIAHRLATLDLHDFPEQARTVVKTDTVAHRLLYTPGAQVDKAGDCSPIERVRLEGELHEWLRADAATDVQIPDDEAAKESIAGFITKAFHQTQSHRIAFC